MIALLLFVSQSRSDQCGARGGITPASACEVFPSLAQMADSHFAAQRHNKRDYILIPSMTEYYQASHKMAVLHCSSPRLGGIVLTPTYNWYTILPGIAPSTKTWLSYHSARCLWYDMEYPNGYPGLATQQLWNFCERSWETACVHRVRGKYLHINNVWLSQIYDRINRGVEVNCPISTTLEESVSTFANLLSDITMYSNSKHCHLLPWVGFIVIYPTAISAYGMLRRGSSSSESQMQTLCFDLSKLEHGQFGSRTISFKTQCTMATRLWRSYQRSLQQ